ncbi:TIGR00180 family glycosyltransferase, partial [Chloroflexota bacterium]
SGKIKGFYNMDAISLIIPTYNRPHYLHRILNYYDKYCDSEKYEIIIADSSSSENKRQNKNTVKYFPNLNILHSKHPSDIHQYSKILSSLDQIKSEYCVICADDDFVTPNGIEQSVDFLEKNRDFTVVQGYYIGFKVRGDVEKESQFWWKYSNANQSITFPNPQDRLCYHLSNYITTTFHGVHRTDFLKMAFTETSRFTDDFSFGELLPTMLTLIYGKLKCLDLLFAARDSGTIRIHTSPEYQKTLADFIKEGTYNDKYAKFRDCLSMHLSKESQLDIEESKKIVDDAMSAYMKKCYPPKSKLSLRSKTAALTTRTGLFLDRSNLPDWLDKGIRKSYRRVTGSNDITEKATDESIPPNYLEDFNRIRHHVLASSG